jgi:ubiquinone/menaquinone biosynthesis C-methylase UbiE
MSKLNLLKSLPKSKRKIEERSILKTEENIRISRQYGFDYFDGERKFGYGGYNYDGRWIPVAKDIVDFFHLKKKSKILDVGCAKGFLIYDLKSMGMDVYGLDISRYAQKNSLKGVSKKIKIGNAKKLPYENNYFDLVLSINTIHNLKKKECCEAIKELSRVAKDKKNVFIQVDSYETKKEKKLFESWVLTAKYHDYTYKWVSLFNKCGYKGYYFWTIIK